jgi:AcrR family transcriptional regulator
MVTRRDEDQEQAILQAASRILSAEGASALTVRRIATEAGCSTMGIYSRFGGKEGVLDALYVEGFEVLCGGLSSLAESDDPVADLRACELEYRELALGHATHYMVMFGGAVPGFTPSAASKARAHEAFDRLVASLQRCIDAGAFAGPAVEAAQTLWSAMHGQVMLELVGINPAAGDPVTQYRDLLDVVIAGLQARTVHADTVQG